MNLPAAAPALTPYTFEGQYEPLLCWADLGGGRECCEPVPDDGIYLCDRHRGDIIGGDTGSGLASVA